MTCRHRVFATVATAACLMAAPYVRTQTPAAAPALVVQGGHAEQVDVAAFSVDGRLLGTADIRGSIRVWETATARQLAALPMKDRNVDVLRFSPDGRLLASAGGDPGGSPATVTLWDVALGRDIATLTGPHDDDSLRGLAFSSDGSFLAAAGHDVHIWNVDAGTHVQTIPMARQVTVAFHPGQNVLAIRSPSEVRLWSRDGPLSDAIELRNFYGPREMVFVRDGDWLIVPDADRLLVIDVERWRVSRRISVGPEASLFQAGGVPDSIVLEAGTRYELWNVATGRKTRDVPTRGVSGVPDPNWSRLAELNEPHASVTLHDQTGARAPQVLTGRTARAGAVTFSADGSHLASASGSAFRIWDLRSGVPRAFGRAPIPGGALPADLDTLAFAPDGRRIVSADLLWNIAEWNTATGELTNRAEFERRDSTVTHACSTDGRWCVSGDPSRIDVRDMESWLVQRSFTPGARYDLAISPDGDFIATGGSDLQIWERRNGRNRTFTAHREPVTRVTFSGDGRVLASVDAGGTLKLWDVASGRELRSVETGDASVASITLDPAGRLVALGGADHAIAVWDMDAGERRHLLQGHVNRIGGLAFSPDGRLLASGSGDGTARIWNTQTGRELALLTGTSDADDWLVVTPEGFFDGSATAAETLVAWRIGTSVYPPERFFDAFFRPGLLTDVLEGRLPAGGIAVADIAIPPAVRILEDVAPVREEPRITLRVRGDGAIDEISLYQNGARVATQPGAPGSTSEYTFDVELVPGDNELSAIAVGGDRVTSNPDTIRLTYNAPLPSRPTLHLLAVGVSRYRGAAWQLGFARADAEALATFFNGAPRTLFADVHATVLTDEEATRLNIDAAIAAIASAARPEDVVLIYFAGHGLASGGRYYLLPHEMQDETSIEADVRKYGISDTALLDGLRGIKALKRVVVLDACESGGALEVLSRSPAAERLALEMLARAEGLFIIAASTRQQEAVEIPELGHGILTYALLSGLGAKGDASVPETVTMHGLLQYVSHKVPELSARFGRATRQVPVTFHRGMDFPLVVR